jgi:hypothetical protein
MMENSNGSAATEADDYYASFPDEDFHSLDDPVNIENLLAIAHDNATDSFVVDFSDRAAFCAFDLPVNAIASLLEAERPDILSVRWINIYRPFKHRTLLSKLARRYDFSPRLLGLMASDPKQPRAASRTALDKSVRGWGAHSPASLDTECEPQDELSEHSSVSSNDSSARGNLYKIVDDIYHYSSVDLGRAYVCIGYNSLYGTKSSGEEEIHGPLPNCTRVVCKWKCGRYRACLKALPPTI